jgi:hypothetical protein
MFTNNELKEAIKINNILKVKEILADKNFDPSIQENISLKFVCIRGYFEIAELIINHPKVNPAIPKNHAIILANKNNHEKIVTMLWNKQNIKNSLNKDSQVLYERLNKKDLLQSNVVGF